MFCEDYEPPESSEWMTPCCITEDFERMCSDLIPPLVAGIGICTTLIGLHLRPLFYLVVGNCQMRKVRRRESQREFAQYPELSNMNLELSVVVSAPNMQTSQTSVGDHN